METHTYKTFEDQTDGKRKSDDNSGERNARGSPVWAIAIVFSYVCLGSLILCYMQDIHIVTAFYLTLQVTTTIGYGDVTANDLTWQVFVIFYIILGVGVVANIMDEVFNYFLKSTLEGLRKTAHSAMENLGTERQPASVVMKRCWMNFAVSAVVFISLVLLWAVLFMMLESCTCSYGWTAIEGCVDGTFDQCKETGGKLLSWGSAIYFAVVTFSTVGFGDFSPNTLNGRVASVILMPLGVLVFVNFVGAVGQLIGAYKQRDVKTHMHSHDILRWVDKEDNGRLDRREFCLYYLLKENIVNKEVVEHIDNLFDAWDKRGKGSLSYDARKGTIEGVVPQAIHPS